MIISASRRTDIPSFYASWMMNRLRAGYCNVPNPFNPKQVSRISLRPEDVDAIVFWTRNARPLMACLEEIDRMGYRYYFLYTIADNGRALDAKSPPVDAAAATFQALSERLGDPRRVIWRYDPIVLSPAAPPEAHLERFGKLAQRLAGYTRRCVVSVVDVYEKAARRLETVGVSRERPPAADLQRLFSGMKAIADAHGLDVVSCAEDLELEAIRPGKCVDDRLLEELFGLDACRKKDGGQRPACGCVQSRDIGMYDTCLFECRYCYATRDFDLARRNHARHDPRSPSLL